MLGSGIRASCRIVIRHICNIAMYLGRNRHFQVHPRCVGFASSCTDLVGRVFPTHTIITDLFVFTLDIENEPRAAGRTVHAVAKRISDGG